MQLDPGYRVEILDAPYDAANRRAPPARITITDPALGRRYTPARSRAGNPPRIPRITLDIGTLRRLR